VFRAQDKPEVGQQSNFVSLPFGHEATHNLLDCICKKILHLLMKKSKDNCNQDYQEYNVSAAGLLGSSFFKDFTNSMRT
jgi:hypothetical protein